jgi:hypothetical protein
MPDTSTAYDTLVTTTIANGATWTSWTIVETRHGMIEFTDVKGNKVRSRQATLRKLVDTIKLKKLS